MSFRLSTHHLEDIPSAPDSSREHSSSSEDEDEDQTWDDWVSDSMEKQLCKSLFDEEVLPSAIEALAHDKSVHGFDLEQTCSRLSLDVHGRIRLINWIRKEKPSSAQVAELKGREAFLSSDHYLIPVLEDDPLLQLQPADSDWSDEENNLGKKEPASLPDATRIIHALQARLQKSQQDLVDYRNFVSQRLNLASLKESLHEAAASSSSTHIAAPLRDDDSHYFQSYGENDIHAVMIQDKVRTATYATFIMTHPEVFRDAIVLDVGCGTGVLSLFAARVGAKRVFAVDASDIAEKAEQIVKANGFENVITVLRGKVEDITLPDDVKEVDVIVSEWMGYALLYESMLDSVLRARDRFLRKDGGIIAPSQTQIMLGLCSAAEIYKERVEFWSDVYGFDMSAMATDLYEDAIVDVVGGETLASQPVIVKDLYLPEISPRHLDFSSPFTLIVNVARRTKIRAFVLYFDAFFSSVGEPIPEGTEVYTVGEGDPILAEVWQVGKKPHIARRMSSGDGLKPRPKITSFSTGPQSVPTHWKQTLFLLRDPIIVDEGYVVQGTFKCRKSEDNSRELEVEIHFSVRESIEEQTTGEVVVQTFKVR